MAEIERLTMALPAPMARSVREAVENDQYASTREVIRDALRLWESRRHLRERDVAVLRHRWDEGKTSGRAGRLDARKSRPLSQVAPVGVADLLVSLRMLVEGNYLFLYE